MFNTFQLRNGELDLMRLGKCLSIFQTKDIPVLNHYWNYYEGKHAITYKRPTDTGKPCSKIVANFCKETVANYQGYMTGQQINYSSDDLSFDKVIDTLHYNDYHQEDSELLKQALIFGRAVELCYIDEDGEVRFKLLDPRECIPIYDDTLNQNLLYGVRFYKADFLDEGTEDYFVEVYDESTVRKYRSTAGFSSFYLLDEQPHFFKQVPITFFSLNKEEESIFAQIISLNDAYNELLSGEVEAFNLFSDAYLILKGVRADEDDLVSMKEHRVLMLDTDADASYLTKNVSDTQVEDMLDRLKDEIHSKANSPDFTQESFGTTSGVALKFRLIGFENTASAIEAYMRKALQKRIELICEIINLKGDDAIWQDIDIVFTRNLPADMGDISSTLVNLRGLVSQETLLAQIPFITDPAEELAKVKKENEEKMSMYDFANKAVINDEEDTEQE